MVAGQYTILIMMDIMLEILGARKMIIGFTSNLMVNQLKKNGSKQQMASGIILTIMVIWYTML